mgnify:CR=1 FL=1
MKLQRIPNRLASITTTRLPTLQTKAGAEDLRAVLRFRHDYHRLRKERARVSRYRIDASLRRCGGEALAGVHRKESNPRSNRTNL